MAFLPIRSARSSRSTAQRLLGVATAWLLLLAPQAQAQPAPDLDADGVANALDDCPANPNPHQEDSDGDGVGDVCDPDTINPILERVAAAGTDTHARTPWHRLKVSGAPGLQLGAETGLGAAANGGIGVPGSNDSGVLSLAPTALVGPPGGPHPARRSATSSRWRRSPPVSPRRSSTSCCSRSAGRSTPAR